MRKMIAQGGGPEPTPDIQSRSLILDGLHEDSRGWTPANMWLVSGVLEQDILDIPVPCTDVNHSFMFSFLSLAVTSLAKLLNPWKAGCAGSIALSKENVDTNYRWGRWMTRETAAARAVQHIRDLLRTGARVSHHVSDLGLDTVFREVSALLFGNVHSDKNGERCCPAVLTLLWNMRISHRQQYPTNAGVENGDAQLCKQACHEYPLK